MPTRVGLFVDGANAFYMQKAQGWWIDFAKFRRHFGEQQGKEITECFYFTGMPPFWEKDRVSSQRAFCNWLTRLGYTVIQKELKVVARDDQGRETRKANLDTEITLHVVQSLPQWDEMVLLEGDGDFAPLAMQVRANQKRVVCVSSRRFLARELLNAATHVVDLDSIRSQIEDTRERPPKKQGGTG
jgi:uncharacterized LabA/DUF88 family protein